jgi:hypothetical protein
VPAKATFPGVGLIQVSQRQRGQFLPELHFSLVKGILSQPKKGGDLLLQMPRD